MVGGLKSLSVWQQLFSYFLIFIIVPVFIVFSVYSFIYIKSTTQNIIQYSENELEVLDDNFSNYLRQFKVLSDSVLLNNQFMSIINAHAEGKYEYDSQYIGSLQNALKDIYSSYQNINTLIFVDNKGEVVSVGYPYFDEVDSIMIQYQEKMESEGGKIIWGYLNSNKGKKIIICRKINYVNSLYQIQNYGYMLMLVDEETLFYYYHNLKPVHDSKIYIVDKDKVIISSNMRESIGSVFSIDMENKDNYLQNGKSLLVSRTLGINGWTIAYLIPKSKINNNLFSTLAYVAIITIICIILAAAASLFLAKRINQPLLKLSESMKLLEKGNFNIVVETKQTNEIGQLYNSFNIMARELNTLINRNIAMELKTKEAQIQSYQRQINPHFIYNTLDMIRMMAILNENEKIEDAVICLSEVLRFNLKAEKEVLIDYEIKNIEFYFRILKLRYGDNFDYEIKVSEEIRRYCTLKFLLQPFIENSVQHGLEKVTRRGYICIIAKKINDEIIFIIRDNGIGIEKDKLDDIRRSIDETTEQHDCIGMKNVHQRIRLRYGEKYGIEIVSKYNKQTSVMLHIPAYIKEEK